MAKRACEECGKPLDWTQRSDARFCCGHCRVTAHRKRKAQPIPDELRDLPRWTRRDGKRPVMVDGRSASSTDPATWTTFTAVQRGAGDGFGIMLGDGLACYDLDHCLVDGKLADLAPRAADVLRRVEPIYAEVSMSGDGLHLFVRAPEAPGTKQAGVEFYSRARFIAVTGNRWDKEGRRAKQAPPRRS